MAKKSKKRKTGSAEVSAKKAKTAREEIAEVDESSQPMDYGGLPARDLKKNLGCG